MAIKKNTNNNLNLIKKDGVSKPFEKEGFLTDKPTIIEENNVKVQEIY